MVDIICDSMIDIASHLSPLAKPSLHLFYNNVISPASVKSDSLIIQADSSAFTVNDTNPTLPDTQFAASSMTHRYAVLKLGLAEFWKTTRDSVKNWQYRDIMSARMNLNIDTAASRMSDTINFYFDMFEQPVEQIDTSTMSKGLLAIRPAISLEPLYLTNLNRLLETQPDTGYLYIMFPPNKGFATTLFTMPESVTMKAVFSNPW
jgi:hypothetical protein